MRRTLPLLLPITLLVTTIAPSILAQDPYPKPKYDREQFRKSGQSLLRADLLARRNLSALSINQSDADVDEVPIEALASSTGVALKRLAPLNDAWARLVAAGYFDPFNMKLEAVPGKRPGASLANLRHGEG